MRHLSVIQLIAALILLAGIVGAYGLWYRMVGKASAETAALAEGIRARSQDSERAAAAKEALGSLVADEEGVRQYLVRTGDVVPFLERLEDTGTALGSSVDVVSVSAEQGAGRERIVLSLKIAGSFDSVLRTLGAIEYGPYDSALTGLSFDTVRSAESGTPEGWTAAATFSIGTQATSTPAAR